MKTLTLSLLAIIFSLGCATDPNKQVTDARATHAEDVANTQEDESNLEAGQVKDHAALDSTHEKQDASMEKQAVDDASKFNKSLDSAEANVVEARRTFRAAATARLEQVAAKTTALEGKRAAKKVTEPSLATVRTKYAAVKTSVTALDSVSDANWFVTKKNIETDLASLEKDVSDIESRL